MFSAIPTVTLCFFSSMHHHVAADASFTTIKNGFGHYVFIADNQTILVGGEVDGKITLLTFDPTLQLTSVEKKKMNSWPIETSS